MLMLHNGRFEADPLAQNPRLTLNTLADITTRDLNKYVLELEPDTTLKQLSEHFLVKSDRFNGQEARQNEGLKSLNSSIKNEEALDFLANFAAIEIIFPSFADGRGFTLARDIRERLGFTGNLRAKGHLIPDQCTYLGEVGFDNIILEDSLVERQSRAAWENKSPHVSLRYQPHVSGDRHGPAPVG